MFDWEGKMRRLMNALMLITMLFVFVQSETQPAKGRISNDFQLSCLFIIDCYGIARRRARM